MPRRTACSLLAAFLLTCAPASTPDHVEVPVRVGTVVVDHRYAPVLLLEEENGSRVLPIWIGTAEANSIAAEMEKRTPPRPNFHDLAKRVIQTLDGEVLRVVVTELRGNTYYATMVLRANGRTAEIDVRPSDGIAVALRAGAPILVRASVFDEAGRGPVEDGSQHSIEFEPFGAQPDGNSSASSSLSL